MSRLAFFSPLPPAASGIADYSLDILALLAQHAIDVFHQQAEVEAERMPSHCSVHPAAEFFPRHRDRPYELAIYQMGNSPDHDFVYEPLARVPGLLVLHDLVLHHARARMLLDTPEVRAYSAHPSSGELRTAAQQAVAAYAEELEHCYPGRGDRLAEVHLAITGDHLPYAYPLFRLPVEASRLTAVHNPFMAQAVAAEVQEAAVAVIPMPFQATAVDPGVTSTLRERYHLPPRAFVVGCFGRLTREKRIGTVARAVARAAVGIPDIRLLLVGPVPDRDSLQQLLVQSGVADRTIVTGRVPLAELPAHAETADVVVQLRYPTARETSAALLRVLAQGRPTVISDLDHLSDIPAGAVLRADVADEEGEVTRALLRLAPREEVRRRMGRSAADFIRNQHSPERCRAAYEQAIAQAMARPNLRPRPRPAHWPPAMASGE